MKSLDLNTTNFLIIVGSFNNKYNLGFNLYQLKPAEKAIIHKNQNIEAINPIHFQFSNNKRILYSACASGEDEGKIATFEIDSMKADLSLISMVDSEGLVPCYVSMDHSEEFVFTANYTSGNIAGFPIKDSGHLNKAVYHNQHLGKSVHPERQKQPHVHCIVPHPNNKFFFAIDLGTDEIISYRFNQEEESPLSEPHSAIKFPPGSGPRHMSFHPREPWAYVVTELSNQIHCFDLSPEGNLVEKGMFNLLPESYDGESFAADILIDPSGKYLYATNRGHESICVFRVSEKDGNLTYQEHVSSEGKFPWSLDISDHGEFVLVANQHSNNVVIFQRDLSHGSLSKFLEITDVESPVSARFLAIPEAN